MAEPHDSLRALYDRAQNLEKQIQSLQTSSEEYQTRLRSALSTYEECRTAADRVSLFSPNESLEDLASSEIQYLSISFHVAELLQRDSVRDRKAVLRGARSSYEDFFHLLDQYGALSPADQQMLGRYTDDRDGFRVVASSSDPSRRRDAKIARLKDEKALRQKLEQLGRDPGVLAAADDDALRDLRLAELALNVHQAFQALDMIAQELGVLAMAPDVPPPDPRALGDDHRQRTGQTAAGGYSDRVDPPLRSMLQGGRAGPILDSKGKPMQPFVLLDQRQRLRDGVFRPGHNLPTMTIDEYLEEERRRGGIIEGGGEPPVVEPNEDDLEAADRETMKQREWDEFKEENPRGSGNTINRG